MSTDVPTVWVVDDNVDYGEGVAEILRDDGFATWCATRAEDAFERLEGDAARPACIMLDLILPGMSAQEFLERLRSDERLAAVPVVLVTAAWDKVAGARLAVDGVLLKPFDISRMLDVVRRFSGRGLDAPAPPGR